MLLFEVPQACAVVLKAVETVRLKLERFLIALSRLRVLDLLEQATGDERLNPAGLKLLGRQFLQLFLGLGALIFLHEQIRVRQDP